MAPPQGSPSSYGLTAQGIANLRIFNRRFTAMINAGTSMVRIFTALQDLPEPFGSAVRDLLHYIEIGHTLSSRLRFHPSLFPEVYVALVRAGEGGGTLEICTDRLGKLLQLDWRLATATAAGGGSEASVLFRMDSGRAFPELPRSEQLATLILFCEMLSVLLMSGVPVLQSFGLASPVMPGRGRQVADAVAAIRSDRTVVPALAQSGFFPLFVLELIDTGERNGTLDITLHEAALALAEELEIEIGQPISW